MPLPDEVWKGLVFALLSGYAANFQPLLGGWEVAEFGSHRYLLALPDSDVDFQLKLRCLPPGLAAVDVTMAIGTSIRRLAAQWQLITGVACCRFGFPRASRPPGPPGAALLGPMGPALRPIELCAQ